MPEVIAHVPGTFCWPELSTSDQRSAVSFYGELFGWGVNERPIGPGEVYTMFTLRGLDVAAAYTMRPEERLQGVPPHWNSYVTVPNVDSTAQRAGELGGNILAAPFDVMDVGRMAVVQDPTGAVFCLWQAKQHIGARVLNEPGALVWTELTTHDPTIARDFYTQLFGWTTKSSEMDERIGTYTEFTAPGAQAPTGGMMKMPPGLNAPSYWMPYFQVADVDASTRRAEQLSARVMVKPADIPGGGRFSIATDPQGAFFGLFARK